MSSDKVNLLSESSEPGLWDERKLSDILDLVIDNRGRNPESYSSFGVPIIDNYLIVGEGKVDLANVNRYIDIETYRSFIRKYIKKSDVLMTLVGNGYGNVAITPSDDCIIIQNTIGLRCDHLNDNVFLYYLLRNNRERLMNLNRGAAQPSIKVGDVLELSFLFPPLSEQKRIAKVLSSLDDKIELNRQINQTLEQIAQAMFKSWFVDFEPTRAKIAAKEAGGDQAAIEQAAMCAISGKTPDQLNLSPTETLAQLKATAALFPDALIDSELGEIPRGWEVSNLKSVTTEIRRGISPAYVDENGVCVINQKCIRNHKINFSLSRLNDPIKKKVEDRLLQVGDILVNSTGIGTLGRLAPIRYLTAPAVHDSHVTVVRADTSEISNSFLIGLMLENETFIEASGIGSTGQTELNRQALEDILFAKPTLALSRSFESMVEPMNRQIAIHEKQELSLSQTRDVLLPNLLSGSLFAKLSEKFI